MLELVLLSHIHSRLVHFLWRDPLLNIIHLLFGIPVMERALNIRFVVVLLSPRRSKSGVNKCIVVVRVD